MKNKILAVVFAMALSVGVLTSSNVKASNLNSVQIQSIISLLQAFGVDNQTVSNVYTALVGTQQLSSPIVPQAVIQPVQDTSAVGAPVKNKQITLDFGDGMKSIGYLDQISKPTNRDGQTIQGNWTPNINLSLKIVTGIESTTSIIQTDSNGNFSFILPKSCNRIYEIIFTDSNGNDIGMLDIANPRYYETDIYSQRVCQW